MLPRREALRAGALALAALATGACRRALQKDSGADSGTDSGGGGACDPPRVDTAEEGWVALPLADYPALAEVGGAVTVDLDEVLLHAVVAQPSAGCYVAVWSICSHGACALEWAGDRLRCPCHGSVFDTDGAVLEGPATEPVRAFPAARAGDAVWVYRPL